ncbi:BON domain-containing protein [Polaromonas sp.]|uniref:BON domain-containing protein n=1 Tax=Polaromonas sp. TaxID=1869339 RepID=UPI002FC79DCE
MKPVAWVLACTLAVALPTAAQQRSNAFDDPFVQVTSAIAACPVPAGPLYTEQEARDAAHVRSHHGTSCYRSGRCRLPNSYLYDREMIPRVEQYIRLDGRFNDTSVWVVGERRLVTLLGCVQSKEQADALEKAVWLVDDVMGVINYLGVPGEAPRYPLAK